MAEINGDDPITTYDTWGPILQVNGPSRGLEEGANISNPPVTRALILGGFSCENVISCHLLFAEKQGELNQSHHTNLDDSSSVATWELGRMDRIFFSDIYEKDIMAKLSEHEVFPRNQSCAALKICHVMNRFFGQQV